MISAEGEQQAAQKLFEAAEVLSRRPEAMQLRYLSTLAQIGQQNSTAIVFPFPTDLLSALSRMVDGARTGASSGALPANENEIRST